MRSAYGIQHTALDVSIIYNHAAYLCIMWHDAQTTNKRKKSEKRQFRWCCYANCLKRNEERISSTLRHTNGFFHLCVCAVCCVHCGKKIRCDILFSWMQLKYAKLAVRKNFFCQSRRWEIAAKRKAWTRVGEIDDTFIFLHSTKFSVGIPYWLLFIHVSWQFQLKRCVCHICWILFVKCVFEYE